MSRLRNNEVLASVRFVVSLLSFRVVEGHVELGGVEPRPERLEEGIVPIAGEIALGVGHALRDRLVEPLLQRLRLGDHGEVDIVFPEPRDQRLTCLRGGRGGEEGEIGGGVT